MRTIEQIIHDNGGDNTPILDTHNLTGRALPREVEPEWVPFASDDPVDEYEMEGTYAPLADAFDDYPEPDEFGIIGHECG